MPIQEWSDRIWVVQLSSDPSFSEDLLNLIERIQHAPKVPDLVLDLSGVTRINSSNLSQMLRVRKLAIEQSTKLRLAGPPDSIWAVFLTTGLDKVFEFSTDVSTALAGLQMNQNPEDETSS